MNHKLVIENGQVWLPGGYVVNEPVWVDEGRIVGVGRESLPNQSQQFVRIDAEGGSVLPGFQDGHIHPHHWGVRQLGCDLTEVRDGQEALKAIGEHAQQHLTREWVTGGGWVLHLFGEQLPTKEMLDSVVPDRPAYFPYTDGHGAWVNSEALRRAGIDSTTPDPANGRINRDSKGEPTGILEEAAMRLIARHIPEFTPEEFNGAFKSAYQQLLEWGVVGWQDAMVGKLGAWPENFDSYIQATDSGEMKAHVVGALLWDPLRGLEQIDELLEKREQSKQTSPFFRAGSIKLFQDGVIENFTAGLLDPYLDKCGHQTENYGQSITPPEDLKEIIAALAGHEFQVHVHALGDRAVRETLDAIEYANARAENRDLRHTIAHIQVIDPVDIPRFQQLGVIANSQELWACHEPEMDQLTVPFLGQERGRLQYPFGSLVASGAAVAGGSDWPVSTANPLDIIHTAVNRSVRGAEGDYRKPFNGEQALSLSEALRAHTSGVAYLNHDDQRSGTITKGKAGDLVILDRDIFNEPTNEIGDAHVRHTILAGDVVYSRA